MRILLTAVLILAHTFSSSQEKKGSLFIIGGGDRPPAMMKEMLNAAALSPNDHIVILPMSSSEMDTSFYYTWISLDSLCTNTIANLAFTKDKVNDKIWLDSVRRAKLIYITGGDQSRFMEVVRNTPLYDAIHEAYAKGALIGGTSAGAAVMSKQMITGNELIRDTTYASTYRKIWKNNMELQPGLGLLDKVIIDQHFVWRSRYNRLLSAISEFPDHTCIGIDESTAVLIRGKKVRVIGESHVVIISKPKNLKVSRSGLFKFEDIEFGLYTEGDVYEID